MDSTTVVVDFDSGIRLASYSGILGQVKVGADFYVGQVKYIVKELSTSKDGGVLFVYVQRA